MGRPTNFKLGIMGWITNTRIDMRDDVKLKALGGFKSPLKGGGGMLWQSHYRAYSLFALAKEVRRMDTVQEP